MSEEERAAHYQAHKDNFEEWGEPLEPPRDYKPRLRATITVRFDEDEAEANSEESEAGQALE